MNPMTKLDALLKRHGIVNFSATEIVRLGQRRGSAINTIPPEHIWWRIIPTLNILERVRREVGSPIQVLSGWRSAAYNQAVGGKSDSMHLYFNAIDWRPRAFEKWSVKELGALVLDVTNNTMIGLGVYDDKHPADQIKTGFIHIDTRGFVMGRAGAHFSGWV